MIPGELFTDGPDITLNPGRRTLAMVVENSGDRPIQVGSHYHFAETNAALRWPHSSRCSTAWRTARNSAGRSAAGRCAACWSRRSACTAPASPSAWQCDNAIPG